MHLGWKRFTAIACLRFPKMSKTLTAGYHLTTAKFTRKAVIIGVTKECIHWHGTLTGKLRLAWVNRNKRKVVRFAFFRSSTRRHARNAYSTTSPWTYDIAPVVMWRKRSRSDRLVIAGLRAACLIVPSGSARASVNDSRRKVMKTFRVHSTLARRWCHSYATSPFRHDVTWEAGDRRALLRRFFTDMRLSAQINKQRQNRCKT